MKKIFAAVIIAISCLLNYAQGIPSEDSVIAVDYNKWANNTWYSTPSIYFAFGWSQSDINVNSAFVCNGKTSLRRPCKSSRVYLLFKYSYPYSNQTYQPFDYRHKTVQAFVNGKRIPLGEANVEYDGNFRKFNAVIAISLTQFKQLATAKSLELAIGNLSSDKMNNTPFNTLYRYIINPDSSFSQAKPFDINDNIILVPHANK